MEIENVTYHPLKESLIKENGYRIIRPKNGVSYEIDTYCNDVTVANPASNNVLPTGNSVQPGSIIEFEIKQTNNDEHFIDFKNSFVKYELTFSSSVAEASIGFKFQRGTGSVFNKVQLSNSNGTNIETIENYHMIQALHSAIGYNDNFDFENGTGFSAGSQAVMSHAFKSQGCLVSGYFADNLTYKSMIGFNPQANFIPQANTEVISTFVHKFKSSLFGKYANKWIPLHATKGFRLLLTLNNFTGAFQNCCNTRSYNIYKIYIKPIFYLKTYKIKKQLLPNILKTSAIQGEIIIPFNTIKTLVKTIDLQSSYKYEIDIPHYFKHLRSILFGFIDVTTYNYSDVAGVTNGGNHIGQGNVFINDTGYRYIANSIGSFKCFQSGIYGPSAFSCRRDGSPAAVLDNFNVYINNININELDISTSTVSGVDRSNGTIAFQNMLLKDALYTDEHNNTILGCKYTHTHEIKTGSTAFYTVVGGILTPSIGGLTSNYNNLYGMKLHDIDGSQPPNIKLTLNFSIIDSTILQPQNLIVFLICDNHYYLNLDTGESRTEF